MTRLLPELKRSISQYEIVPSEGGRFEITVDGEAIYSKLATGTFPDEQQILAAVKQHAGS